MSKTTSLFVTHIYRAEIGGPGLKHNGEIAAECASIAADDGAGQAWSDKNGYRGYTSYASLNDLTWRSPVFAALAGRIQSHVDGFAKELELDLQGRALELDSFWINILEPGGSHAAHIHPHSVISGTYYVEVPKGASVIRFEDPRLPLMMAAPPRKPSASAANRTFATFDPRPGTLLLWESFLRHEVMINAARTPRVSVSFNYRWG